VEQQSGSVLQHAEAQASAEGVESAAAGASGAAAMLKSSRSKAAYLMPLT